VRRAAPALAALALAACGGTAHSTARPANGPAWPSNLAILIAQLRNDVALTSVAGETRADARAALESDSNLYALLVAYDDFGVCRGMVASTASDARAARVTTALTSACRHLERASALFTRATTKGEPAALLAAGLEARRASPWLVRASLELRRVTQMLRSASAAAGAREKQAPAAR
jgi:hypothetical protein